MLQIAKIYPKDIIALIVLVTSLYLIYLGINSVVSGIVIMIVTYYFTQRLDREQEKTNDIKKERAPVKLPERRFPVKLEPSGEPSTENPIPATSNFEVGKNS